jgi:hypothetical protein
MPRFVLDAVTGHAEQLGLGDHDVRCRTPKGTLLWRGYRAVKGGWIPPGSAPVTAP